MADNKPKKHLPKRAMNANRKARRAESWRRTQRKKAARRAAQAEREAKNRRLRDAGLPTPWEQAKARARERRTA